MLSSQKDLCGCAAAHVIFQSSLCKLHSELTSLPTFLLQLRQFFLGRKMDNDESVNKDNMSEVCLLVKAELMALTPKQRRVDCIHIIYENFPKRVAQAVLDDKAIKKERSRERAKKSVVRHSQFTRAEKEALRAAEAAAAAAAALEEEEDLEESEDRDDGHGDLLLPKTQREEHGETSDAAAAKGKGDSGPFRSHSHGDPQTAQARSH